MGNYYRGNVGRQIAVNQGAEKYRIPPRFPSHRETSKFFYRLASFSLESKNLENTLPRRPFATVDKYSNTFPRRQKKKLPSIDLPYANLEKTKAHI